MQVKICGIKDVQTAVHCAQIAVNRIGLILYSQSKRHVSLDLAKEVVLAIQDKKTQVVPVFVKQNPEQINEIIEKLNSRIIQLHGNYSYEQIKKINPKVTKMIALSFNPDGQLNQENQLCSVKDKIELADELLCDNKIPGSGMEFNYPVLVDFIKQIKKPCWLAGGVSEHNLAQIYQVLPNLWGIDLSSSVEINNQKNVELIQNFVNLNNQVIENAKQIA